MQIGDLISFGKFEWQVLDIDGNSVLLITRDIIELRAFHDNPGILIGRTVKSGDT